MTRVITYLCINAFFLTFKSSFYHILYSQSHPGHFELIKMTPTSLVWFILVLQGRTVNKSHSPLLKLI